MKYERRFCIYSTRCTHTCGILTRLALALFVSRFAHSCLHARTVLPAVCGLPLTFCALAPRAVAYRVCTPFTAPGINRLRTRAWCATHTAHLPRHMRWHTTMQALRAVPRSITFYVAHGGILHTRTPSLVRRAGTAYGENTFWRGDGRTNGRVSPSLTLQKLHPTPPPALAVNIPLLPLRSGGRGAGPPPNTSLGPPSRTAPLTVRAYRYHADTITRCGSRAFAFSVAEHGLYCPVMRARHFTSTAYCALRFARTRRRALLPRTHQLLHLRRLAAGRRMPPTVAARTASRLPAPHTPPPTTPDTTARGAAYTTRSHRTLPLVILCLRFAGRPFRRVIRSTLRPRFSRWVAGR